MRASIPSLILPRHGRSRLAALALVVVLVATGCAGGGGDTSTATTEPGGGDRNFESAVEYPEGSTMAAIQERGKLLVGIREDAPPFSSYERATGTWSGFDVEIAKQIAIALFGSRIEGRIEWVPLDPRDREVALESKRVDIAMGRYEITAPRKRFVDFAGPYLIARQEVAVSSRSGRATRITSLLGLNGRKVCVVPTSTDINALKQAVPNADVSVQHRTMEECGAALVGGEVDAIAGNNLDMVRTLEIAGGQLTTLSQPVTTELYGIGVNKDQDDLRSAINDRLEVIEDRYDDLYEQSFGEKAPRPKQPPVDRY